MHRYRLCFPYPTSGVAALRSLQLYAAVAHNKSRKKTQEKVLKLA
jgi:hypothetical protein